MSGKRECLKYIEGVNSDGDDIAGIIISTFEDRIIIGVTERNGADSEVSISLEKAKEVLQILGYAINKVDQHKVE